MATVEESFVTQREFGEFRVEVYGRFDRLEAKVDGLANDVQGIKNDVEGIKVTLETILTRLDELGR